jgi:hypothetical protein
MIACLGAAPFLSMAKPAFRKTRTARGLAGNNLAIKLFQPADSFKLADDGMAGLRAPASNLSPQLSRLIESAYCIASHAIKISAFFLPADPNPDSAPGHHCRGT